MICLYGNLSVLQKNNYFEDKPGLILDFKVMIRVSITLKEKSIFINNDPSNNGLGAWLCFLVFQNTR